ncbi:hypothetical protein V6N13_031064 [Hibiscus sabdariffa]|uniref:Uncharacterized protein n=1 Tax=Hibiscus sabdariffa TaxID=183260 RepID=A0ABR2CNP0_9ROSI
MEKSKRSLLLGVRKKTKSTEQKKKLFSNVVNYLKSDCYMFAPLISPSLSGLKLKPKEASKENKKTRVLKVIGKYMKSDTYMYSPLLSSQLMASPPSEQIQCTRKVTVQVATRMLTTESGNSTAEKQPCEDSCRDNQTVKHMVYHQQQQQRRRCSTPVSAGKGMADVQLRKLVVE